MGREAAIGIGVIVAVGIGTGIWTEAVGGADADPWIGGSSIFTPTANTENPGVLAT